MKIKLIEKLLDRLLDSQEGTVEKESSINEDINYIWEYVIVRWYYSWVHFWKLKSRKNWSIVLNNSRRLYYRWTKGIDLTALSVEGLVWDNLKICWEIKEIEVTDSTVCEIIPCSKKCIKSIQDYNIYLPN